MDARSESYLTRATKPLGVLAIAGFLTYIAVTVAFLALRPDLDPLRRVMSNYAVGPNGFLMDLAFIAFGFGAFAFAVLVGTGSSDRRARVGALLLSTAGVGLFVAALFPTDVNPADAPVTTTGTIHVMAGIVTFVSLTAGCLTVAGLVWWRPAVQAMSVVIVLAFVAVLAGAALDLRGLGQRLFLYTALLWLVWATYRLAWNRKRD